MFRLSRQHNWLILKVVNETLKIKLSQYASGTLIDIGCGEKPYQEMAAPYVEKHIGVDHEDTPHDKSRIDLIATAYNIPYNNDGCDTVLCTDVLEHLEEPSQAISEAFRILKPGGYAIYTVPLFWHLHEEPRDFYRYTEHGLRYLFVKNGFDVIEIQALTGFIVTFSQELVYFLYRFRKGGMINPLWWLVPPVGMLIQVVAYLLHKLDKSKAFTAEYTAVAKKPE